MMMTFKEFITEFMDDEERPMMVDPEFVAKNTRLQQMQKSMATPAGAERFRKEYKRAVMKDQMQRRKQKMVTRVQDKFSDKDQSSAQQPGATL